MPFYTSCQSFVQASLPNLVHFGSLCAAQVPAGTPPPPPAPSATSGYAYVEVTFALDNANIGTSSKKQGRFINEFRADVADALDIDENSVLINKQSLSATSVTVDIFAHDQTAASGLSQTIVTQVNDATSVLRTGAPLCSQKCLSLTAKPCVMGIFSLHVEHVASRCLDLVLVRVSVCAHARECGFRQFVCLPACRPACLPACLTIGF